MPTNPGYWKSTSYLVADGAQTQSTNLGIPEGKLKLIQFLVSFDSGPVLIQANILPIGLQHAEKTIQVHADWKRAGSSGSSSRQGEPWLGEVPTGREGVLQVFTRNDSGSAVTVQIVIAGDKL